MFVCSEIERVGYTAKQLLELYVMEKRAETNLTKIQGITADNDNGIWTRFKQGYDKRNDVTFSWFAKDATLDTVGSFQKIPYGTTKTIAQFATHTGIAITNNTGISDALNWTCDNVLDLISDYFFTVITPDGLTLMLPTMTGTDRGRINQSQCVLYQACDKVYNYAGESTGDIFISDGGDVQPNLITDTYKQYAVNKANALANYIVFSAAKVLDCGDRVTDWKGKKYIVMSGRRVDNDVWNYTAVAEYTDSGAFAGADASPVVPVMASPGEFDFATSIYERTLNGDGDVVSTTGSWQDVPINTETKDEIGGSVSSPNITLPAGKYRIEWMVPFYQGAGLTTRLYNTTSGAEIARGSNGYATTGQEGFSSGVTVVTLTVSTQIKLQCWTQSGTTLGVRGSSSLPTPNRYSRVTIIKLPA